MGDDLGALGRGDAGEQDEGAALGRDVPCRQALQRLGDVRAHEAEGRVVVGDVQRVEAGERLGVEVGVQVGVGEAVGGLVLVTSRHMLLSARRSRVG